MTALPLTRVERMINFFSPSWARDRFLARLELDNIRRFDAASKAQRLSAWHTPATGPSGVLRGVKQTLRNRTRDLERNSAWYRRAVDILTNNVIGAGIKGQVRTDENGTRRRDAIQKRFLAWFESTDCDFHGRLEGYGLQRLIYRTRVVSGECLVRFRLVDRKPKIQILEPDFLDDTKDGIQLDNGGYISQGIGFNRSGDRVAYWLYDEHPSEYALRGSKFVSKRVRAEHIVHYFKIDRPGQDRGVPLGVQIIVRLQELDVFLDAELKKNQIASLMVGVRRRIGGSAKPSTSTQSDGVGGLYPGAILNLPHDEEMSFSTPPQNQMFPEYVRTILMEIAAAFGLTYEMLSGDLKRTNFSSGRMGWIESSRYFKSDQKDFISGVLNPVFSWWLEIDYLRNGQRVDALKAKWFTPHREMIDPSKEIKAMAEAINENIFPRNHVWQQLGFDPDETIAEVAETQKKMDRAGVRMLGQGAQIEDEDKNAEEDEQD